MNYEGSRQREESSVLRIVPSDKLRQGIMQYVCDTKYPNCAVGIRNISVVDFSSMARVASLTPDQITAMACFYIGNNPVMLLYFNSFPQANDLFAGDQLNFVEHCFLVPCLQTTTTSLGQISRSLTTEATACFGVALCATTRIQPLPILLKSANV